MERSEHKSCGRTRPHTQKNCWWMSRDAMQKYNARGQRSGNYWVWGSIRPAPFGEALGTREDSE